MVGCPVLIFELPNVFQNRCIYVEQFAPRSQIYGGLRQIAQHIACSYENDEMVFPGICQA